MKNSTKCALSKVPEVTLTFWIIKIAATTLGETGGDVVSMSMNLGYFIGTTIFMAIFLIAVFSQIKMNGFHPLLYWITIIATTTATIAVIVSVIPVFIAPSILSITVPSFLLRTLTVSKISVSTE